MNLFDIVLCIFKSVSLETNFLFFSVASMTPPSFTENLQPHHVREGQPVRLTVRVAGHPRPNVTWYREGSRLISSPDFEIIQEGDFHSLYIPEVFYEDSGKFTVMAQNPAGQAQCSAEVHVQSKNIIQI